MISIIASIFPFTAPTMMSVRSAFAVIPLEQYLACIGLTILFAAFSVWIAARAYELGMLRYGQKLKFRELFVKNNRGGK
jgi:ABC-type Na+ efflux pump permease subunit